MLFPLVCWFFWAAFRIAVVLCMVRVRHNFWLTDSQHLVFVSLPFLVEVFALVWMPFAPLVVDRNNARQKQMRRSFLATRTEERRNNMRANMFYLLVPGIASLIADIAALIAMGDHVTHKTENTLLWAFGISAVAWFFALLALKCFGPEYGPPPETTCHSYEKPVKKPSDTSRTHGMDPDSPGDEW